MHRIWQNHSKYPHEIFALERRHRTFIFASELIVMEQEEAAEKERKRLANKK